MKIRILIIIFLVTLTIAGSTLSVFAQDDVRVLVRQIGTSTYSYKIINNSEKKIKSFQLGFNRHQEGNEEELMMVPSSIESPEGWGGYSVFLEESNYLHIHWHSLTDAHFIQPGSFVDSFVAYMPQPYDLMKQASFTAIYAGGSWYSGKVEIDASIPILFDGKGQRPFDVNTFLAYLKPMEAQTTLPQGQNTYNLFIFYGKTIIPETFKTTLNGIDIKGRFKVNPDTSEVVKLNLEKGRNTLILSIDGIKEDGKKATDTDRLIFLVP